MKIVDVDQSYCRRDSTASYMLQKYEIRAPWFFSLVLHNHTAICLNFFLLRLLLVCVSCRPVCRAFCQGSGSLIDGRIFARQ